MGLHFRAPEHLKSLLEPPDVFHKPQKTPGESKCSYSYYYLELFNNLENYCAFLGPLSPLDHSIPPKGLLLVTHEPSSVNTEPGPHSRGSTLRAFSVGDKEVDLLLPGTARYSIWSLFKFSSNDKCNAEAFF